jgi:hypothetical protein
MSSDADADADSNTYADTGRNANACPYVNTCAESINPTNEYKPGAATAI